MDEAMCISRHDVVLDGMGSSVCIMDYYLWQAPQYSTMGSCGGKYFDINHGKVSIKVLFPQYSLFLTD